MSSLPRWAEWPAEARASLYSVGIEEELMLIDETGRLSFRGEEVLESIADRMAFCSLETHAAVIEVETTPQPTVANAVAALGGVRNLLIEPLAALGLRAAGAGTHPMATWVETQVPEQERYQEVLETMRELARREPTMAMHVHVTVPSADAAIAALTGIRERLPLVLALSANSPFWQARDSGLASTRTSLFGAFPRTGLPPWFGSYEEWAERVDFLIRTGAIPEPTFLWWDARLQPRYGTIEIRIADAQSRLEDVTALVALIQCLVKAAVEGDIKAEARREVVAENRFLASRDGVEARLMDVREERLVPLSEWVGETLELCGPHARDLRCESELSRVRALSEANGASRQRDVFRRDGIEAVAPWLADELKASLLVG
ncbi:MAG: YbdK family carboxylate-amine ligase [Actinomycetota bacterium]|nr:YbdK family carboxylate-amine ligase [Actinomycetota bacterium]